MGRAAIVALTASLSLGCHSLAIDPATGRYAQKSFMMETKLVCHGGTCIACARGKRVAIWATTALGFLAPEVGLAAVVIGTGIEAISDDDDWCEGFPELLELPRAKPLERGPAPALWSWSPYLDLRGDRP